MKRSTLLGDWLKKTGTTQCAFAKRTHIPSPQISMYARGVRRPGLRYGLAIEQATGGAVPASYWPEVEIRTPSRGSSR